MSKLTDTQPANINHLNVVGFEVNIARLPNVEFFCQRVNAVSYTHLTLPTKA